ncbi:MAG TPA: ribosome biogenesis GTPase YlqF [Acholeplasmataceae bacterium]|jgi:ribosome biogenesis GTPase A|nr:ribosome biogenesis GTPase YlqF [Acholeplasmataceae bacterium]
MIQWFPGHMAKAKREIEERLRIVDIVFELLDARIPYSSQNPLINELLQGKPKLVLLMKTDLADPKETKLWRENFQREDHQVLEVDALSGFNRNLIIKSSLEILADKIERDRKRGLKARGVRAMIVGIPNVGKSTLINRLVKRKATRVANKPGVTRAQQWISITGELELLDTPGVLWPKFEDHKVGIHLALTGAIRDEIVSSHDLGEYLLNFLRSYYPDNLKERYNLDLKFSNPELIEKIAQDRGFMQSDYEERVYNLLLSEFRNNLLGRITLDRFNQEEE